MSAADDTQGVAATRRATRESRRMRGRLYRLCREAPVTYALRPDMKTITEFSGFIIQRAAQIRGKQTPSKPAAPTEAPAEARSEAAADARPAAEGEAAAEGQAAEEGEQAAPADAADAAPANAAPALTPEDEALGTEMDVSGDRLARLVEALTVVGEKSADVRLVRVFAAGETEPRGGKKIGGHVYVIDYMPKTMSQTHVKNDRGGKGGRPGDRGGKGGFGGGGGGGAKGAGGFSFGPPGGRRDEAEARGPMPSSGVGWTLSRAEVPAGEQRRGGKPGGRPGAPRGPGRPGGGPGRPGGGPGGGGPGGRPGGGGGPGGQRPSGPRAGGGPGGAPGAPGDRPPGAPNDRPRGPRPTGPRPPGAPGGANRPGGRGPGGGGRGPGGAPRTPEVVHRHGVAPTAAPAAANTAAPEADTASKAPEGDTK